MKLPLQVDLSGKVAVVTGAGGVLCSMFAKALALSGAKVALLDINLEAAEGYAAEIRELGGNARAYKANVLDKEALEEVHTAVAADLGLCDILLNGAGGNNPRATTSKEFYEEGDIDRTDITTFFNLEKAGIEFVFSLNFMGTVLPTQVFARDMIGRPGCNIVNISSMSAFTPLTKTIAYSAAKAGISNFTQWLATHFAKEGIRVNAFAPGFLVTNQNRALLFNEDGTPTPRTGKILNHTPFGRFGDESELVGALLFLLCNEASSFITGTVLPIDGGFSAITI